MLLNRNIQALDVRNKNGETPLLLAAKLNKMDFVEILLEHKASMEYADYQDSTLLHVACKNASIFRYF
jgi:ankyrin repeat protein